MKWLKKGRVCSYEKGLIFKEREFEGLLPEGRYWFFDPLNKVRVDITDMRNPWFEHENLDMIAQSGVIDSYSTTVDLKDHQRALVWIDGRFEKVLGPGLYVLWTGFRKVEIVAGDTVTIEMSFPSTSFSFVNQNLEEVIEPGRFEIMV